MNFIRNYIAYCIWSTIDQLAKVKDVVHVIGGQYTYHYLPNPIAIIHDFLAILWIVFTLPFFFINVFFMKFIQMQLELQQLDSLLQQADAETIVDVVKTMNAKILNTDDLHDIDIHHTEIMIHHCLKELHKTK